MTPLTDIEVLATMESTVMVWTDIYEVITISRWNEGKHFYLSSSRDRIFTPPSYARYEDALHVANIYTENVK